MVLFRQHSDFQVNKLEMTAQEKENHLELLTRVWFDETVFGEAEYRSLCREGTERSKRG